MSLKVRERIDSSRKWGFGKQLAVAAAVSLGAGVAASMLLGDKNTNDSSAGSSPTDPASLPVASEPFVASSTADSSNTTSLGDSPDGAVSTTVPPSSQPSTTARDTAATSTPTSWTGLEGGWLASDVLASILIEREFRGDGYSRDLFAVWIDEDGDGCDTRVEVLLEESTVEPWSDRGCDVDGLQWFSVFDGVSIEDAGELDIDHLVSLKETWDSGAWSWSAERRIAYGNDLTDPRTLIAVSASSNRSKGDRDPSNWIPAPEYVCQYVADWIAVKARWELTMDESEHGRLRNLIRDRCPGLTINPPPSEPVGG